jgi:phage terminase large subunit GpA-like protein
MWLLPTESLAIDFARQRLNPFLQNTSVLRHAYSAGSRSGGDALLFKAFHNGSTLTVAYAGSESQVAARSARILIVDEVDRLPLLSEGDSLALAYQRVATFYRNSLIVQACSPTWSATSRINSEYRAGDQRRPFVQCPHCQEWQVMEFFKKAFKCATVEWRKEGDKNLPDTAHLYCGFCGNQWSELDRMKAVTTKGAIRWYQTKPFECCGVEQLPMESRRWEWSERYQVGHAICEHCDNRAVPNDHISFQVSKLYSQSLTTVGLAEKWIATLNDTVPEARAEFFNLFLGECADPATFGKTVETHELSARRESIEVVPRGVIRLVAFADFQGDRVEVLVLGIGVGEECWVIDYHVLPGDTSQPAVYANLKKFLNGRYPYDDGGKGNAIRISGAGFDSGDGRVAQRIYDFVRGSTGWWATKGAADHGGKWAPIIAPLKQVKTRDTNYKPEIIGTNSAKQMIYDRLKIETPGPGYIHFPTYVSDIWLDQLTSEHLRYTVRNGFRTARYEKKSEKRANEVLDCFVGALAVNRLLTERLGWNLERTAAMIAQTIGETTNG